MHMHVLSSLFASTILFFFVGLLIFKISGCFQIWNEQIGVYA